jgi:hypothetical protein
MYNHLAPTPSPISLCGQDVPAKQRKKDKERGKSVAEIADAERSQKDTTAKCGDHFKGIVSRDE